MSIERSNLSKYIRLENPLFCSVGKTYDTPKVPKNASKTDLSWFLDSKFSPASILIFSLAKTSQSIKNLIIVEEDWLQKNLLRHLVQISDLLKKVSKYAVIIKSSGFLNSYSSIFIGLNPSIKFSINNIVYVWAHSIFIFLG